MVRHVAVTVALTVVALWPLSPGTLTAGAQEASCASTAWLEPATGEESTDADPSEFFERYPAWLAIELIDACSGEAFTLADFAGKTIYIEAMATWCPPCRDQLAQLKEAAVMLPEEDRPEFVLVALSTEIDLPRESLADYASANEFPFLFAVMPAEMLQAMAEDLGQEIAVPPATPHLIVAADGTIGDIATGSTSSEDLLALFESLREVDAP